MQHYPVVQVIWARYVFAFVFMMALFLPRSGLALFRWHNVGSQVVRGLLLFFRLSSTSTAWSTCRWLRQRRFRSPARW
jgi:hypothetical protein